MTTSIDLYTVSQADALLAAKADQADVLTKADNLASLADKPTARTNLGLGDASTHPAADFATAAQGVKADAAVPQPAGLVVGDLITYSGSAWVRRPAGPGNPMTGTGSPEGVITAPVGTVYIDTAATLGAVEWTKMSGTGNTGWKVTKGDTGWCDASRSLISPWILNSSPARNTFAIRRVNERVYLKAYLSVSAATISANSSVYVAPTGFRLPPYGTGAGYDGVYGHGAIGVLAADSGVLRELVLHSVNTPNTIIVHTVDGQPIPTAADVSFACSWPTIDTVWPSTLPS